MKKMAADFYTLQNTPKNSLQFEKADGNAFLTIEKQRINIEQVENPNS